MKTIEEQLSIIITSYNRVELLDRTLSQLKDSPIRNCRMTILDNHSIKNTFGVFEKYRDIFPSLSFHAHKVNLGGGCENYIHAIDYCDTEYMWILADDDTYNFDEFADVESHIMEGDVDLIQVGAHNDVPWDWGVVDTPRNLYNRGYKFYKYSSFLPCTIFRCDYFCKYIKQAYDFIHFRYPHFPCLVSAFENDIPIYLSKRRIVTAEIGEQAYSYYVCIRGFVVASDFLSRLQDRREMLRNVMEGFSFPKIYHHVYYKYSDKSDIDYTLAKILSLFNVRERIQAICLKNVYILAKTLQSKIKG